MCAICLFQQFRYGTQQQQIPWKTGLKCVPYSHIDEFFKESSLDGPFVRLVNELTKKSPRTTWQARRQFWCRGACYLFGGLPRNSEDDEVAGDLVAHVVVAVDALVLARHPVGVILGLPLQGSLLFLETKNKAGFRFCSLSSEETSLGKRR